MLIVTDLLMFFIRLSVFFFAIFLMMSFVSDMNTTVAVNEQSREFVQLAENYFDSNLTVGHGIFDANKIIGLSGNVIEPVRICDIPSGVEFFTAGSGTLVSKFGYQAAFGTETQSPIRNEYSVWIKFDERLVPGEMKISLWTIPEEVVREGAVNVRDIATLMGPLSCAVEKAWVYKSPQDVSFLCPFDPCVIYTANDMLCFAEGYRDVNANCRSMPGVSITGEGADFRTDSGLRKIVATPIKKGGAVACNGPDTAKGSGDLETIILCEVAE